MKRQFLALFGISLMVISANAEDITPPTAVTNTSVDLSKVFKNDKEKFGYAIGMYANATPQSPKANIKRFDLDVDNESIVKGFRDSLQGTNTLIPEPQLKEVFAQLNEVIKAKMTAKANKSKQEGIDFLAKNRMDKSIITLTNGIQYKVLKEGTGALPGPEDEVSVNYTGTLIDGTEFDSSVKSGRPLTTAINGAIIQGWKETLKLMKVGSRWKVFIPTELGYAEHPPTPAIPPNSVLIFDMELLSAKAPAPAIPAANTPTAPLTSDIIKVPSAEEIKKGAKIETIKAEDLEKEKAKAKK